MKKVGHIVRENLVETLKKGIEKRDNVFLMSYSHVSGLQMSNLRKSLSQLGAELYVSKNSMAQRALSDLNFERLAQKINGQIAFVWANTDSAEVSKVLMNFSKDCEGVVVRGGLLQGDIIADHQVQQLADLPSREVLLSMLLAAIQSPVSRLMGALNGKTRELLSILKQLSEKKGGS